VRLCSPCALRTRTTSHDLDGRSKKPKHARAKSAKSSKKSNQIEKNERPFVLDLGRHFPVPYYTVYRRLFSHAETTRRGLWGPLSSVLSGWGRVASPQRAPASGRRPTDRQADKTDRQAERPGTHAWHSTTQFERTVTPSRGVLEQATSFEISLTPRQGHAKLLVSAQHGRARATFNMSPPASMSAVISISELLRRGKWSPGTHSSRT
jgi:hypothetical protein